MSQMPDEDRELDAFLARESPLQRQWREASHEEPGSDVDAAVRAAARRAVNAGPRAGGAATVARWRLPLAIAATLVIGSSLTLMVAQHEPPLRADRPAPAPQMPEAPLRAEPGPTPTGPATTGSAPSDSEAFMLRESTPARAPSGAPDRRAVPKVSPAATADGRAEPDASPVPTPDRQAESEASSVPTPDRQAEPEVSRTVTRDRHVAAVPEAKISAAPAEASKPQRAAPAAEDASVGHAPAPPTVMKAPPAAAVQSAPALSNAEPALGATSAAESASHRYALKSRLGNLQPPAAWIERIRVLRRAGKMEDAERELRAFRARHPDYALPEDLAPSHSTPSPANAPARE